jgi:hypothetical protein
LSIDNPRSWKNQVHDFITIIGATFGAGLAGIDSFSDFVKMHFAELSKYFDLSGGVPSHDTYPLHWRLDVVFNEDKACIRNDNAAENMDILRKWALAILVKAKDKKDRSIKSLMRRDAMSATHLVKCLKKIFHA